MKLRIVSTIRSRASWAKVAREMALASASLGAEVALEEDHDGYETPDFALAPELEAALATRFDTPDIDLLITSPDRFADFASARVVAGLMVFEATRWPSRWIEAARRSLDLVVTPSRFCRDTLIDSGLPRSRVQVVPHGIDPRLFHSRGRVAAARDELRVLFVGTPSRRKGLRLLTDAILRLPPGLVSHLTLTIKTESWPKRNDRSPDCSEMTMQLVECGARVRIVEDYLDDAVLADLYRAHDVLCAPHFGEGFGMTVLEAIACGTPVIATDWSGPRDFFDSRCGWPIADLAKVEASPFLPASFPPVSGAWMYGPRLNALAAALMAASDADARAARVSPDRAAAWTWRVAAEAFLNGARARLAATAP